MLQLALNGQVWSLTDAREELAKHFQLTEEEVEELLPSGRQARFANRVAWAKVYLERGGLLSSPKRAHFQITERGREVLHNPPEEISIKFLCQYPEFQEFRSRSPKSTEDESGDESSNTPEEILESAYITICQNLASEVLERVKSCTPRFFEHLVVVKPPVASMVRRSRAEVFVVTNHKVAFCYVLIYVAAQTLKLWRVAKCLQQSVFQKN